MSSISEQAESIPLREGRRVGAVLTAVSYGILGSILLLTRLAGLDRSYWHDEIVTVRDFVRAGPSEILTGNRLNHELFSLVAWAASPAFGDSEIALRLWSVIPFILGVVVVTAWLHVRIGALHGVLYLFLATGSPLLLDVTRQARGYGLAFLAMSVLIVTALEAERSGQTWAIIGFCAAGLVGTTNLPNFAVAFIATSAVLVMNRRLRSRVIVGLTASFLTIGALYSLHFQVLTESSRQEYGATIGTTRVVTAPFDQILLPALLRFDGTPPVASLLWIPLVGLVLVPIVASPCLRSQRTVLILSSGVVTTVLALWITRTQAVPRFFCYLLVPLLMLLASGMASILVRVTTRPPIVRTAATLTLILLFVGVFASAADRVVRLPREAHKDAAAAIRVGAASSVPVFAYMLQPGDLAFYLEKPVKKVRSPAAVSKLCSLPRESVLVIHPWRLPPLDAQCLARPGTRHYRFEQYARGGEMNVWFIPAASQSQ